MSRQAKTTPMICKKAITRAATVTHSKFFFKASSKATRQPSWYTLVLLCMCLSPQFLVMFLQQESGTEFLSG
uniref:Uncharacterized protein n=1 Tax=Anguilla anguilla TaxID=7936 RepID=A0A0E9XL26_ANGAN